MLDRKPKSAKSKFGGGRLAVYSDDMLGNLWLFHITLSTVCCKFDDISNQMIQTAFHALHIGDFQHGLAHALGILVQQSEIISAWHDCTISAFQFGTLSGDTS